MTISSLALLLALAPQPAAAAMTQAEARSAAIELELAQEALADDRRDLAHLDELLRQWERARDSGSQGRLREADRALHAWLEQELVERRRDVELGRGELAQAERELAEEKGDVHGRAAKVSQQQAEVGDDRRDLADERGDLARLERDLQATERLAAELRHLQDRFDRHRASGADFALKARLLRDLRGLAATEVVRDQQELAEALGERREDARDR